MSHHSALTEILDLHIGEGANKVVEDVRAIVHLDPGSLDYMRAQETLERHLAEVRTTLARAEQLIRTTEEISHV